jgi:aminoglycoside phosphotransferase (APT) family kinase protein
LTILRRKDGFLVMALTADPADSRLVAAKARLEAFLASAAGASAARLESASPLAGGAIQENWLLEVSFDGGREAGRRDLVLRTDAPSGVAVSLSRAQEFRLLKVAEAAGVTVPEPLWLCEDESLLGKPFYVMRRVRGTAAGHVLVRKDGPVTDREALAERLGRELAKIHRITPPRVELDFLEMPRPDASRHAIARCRAHLDALETRHPALEWGLRWCELTPPRLGPVVLVHQDFRTGNYMVEEGRLTGVLDWEFCAWGDAMSDIGWFCAKCWRFGQVEREAGGIAGREAFYRGYEATAGQGVDQAAVAYWEVMAHIRWGVIALQQGARFLSGGEASLDLALTGRVRPSELELEILARTAPDLWRSG